MLDTWEKRRKESSRRHLCDSRGRINEAFRISRVIFPKKLMLIERNASRFRHLSRSERGQTLGHGWPSHVPREWQTLGRGSWRDVREICVFWRVSASLETGCLHSTRLEARPSVSSPFASHSPVQDASLLMQITVSRSFFSLLSLSFHPQLN